MISQGDVKKYIVVIVIIIIIQWFRWIIHTQIINITKLVSVCVRAVNFVRPRRRFPKAIPGTWIIGCKGERIYLHQNTNDLHNTRKKE